MLHGTIRNDYSVAQHSVAMLEQCCTYSKQCHNHVATLCCAKNRPCESPRVTSPLKGLYGTSLPNLPLNTCQAGHASWSRKLVTQAGHALHLLGQISPTVLVLMSTIVSLPGGTKRPFSLFTVLLKDFEIVVSHLQEKQKKILRANFTEVKSVPKLVAFERQSEKIKVQLFLVTVTQVKLLRVRNSHTHKKEPSI